MKRKNILKFSVISCLVSAILLLALLFSCKKMPFTNGNMIIETRQLSDFNTIHINDNININMIKSDSSFIEIRAGENLMPNIISEVVDDILIIKNENIGKSKKSCRVNWRLKSVKHLLAMPTLLHCLPWARAYVLPVAG